MTKLIVRRRAEKDLAEARRWYEQQREGLGEEFTQCVDDTLAVIRRQPGAARELFQGVRRVLVKRFPYGVFYKYAAERISVIAVYHNRRDPRGWQARA